MEENQKIVSLIGTGIGMGQNMTLEALEALGQAEVLFGAKRMLQIGRQLRERCVDSCEQSDPVPYICEYEAEKIDSYLAGHPQYQNAAVLLSGDIGFFSGAKKLIEVLRERFSLRFYCGISSVSYFSARLGIAWEDMVLTSQHGRNCNLIGLVLRQEKVFSLFSNAGEVRRLAAELIKYNMKDVKMAVGNNLGMDECIFAFAPPQDYLDYERDGLHVVVLLNACAKDFVRTCGIPDKEFLRDNVPMTKEEVRTIAISKLRLTKDSILYDIGAGTGSISIEAARVAYQGMVFAFEKNPRAMEIIEKNCLNMQASNVVRIKGEALENLRTDDLPSPTHAFLGGTGGNMAPILDCLYQRNPCIRIVINTVTLESLTEVLEYCKRSGRKAEYVQVSVSVSKEVGTYHLMQAQNPVNVICLY